MLLAGDKCTLQLTTNSESSEPATTTKDECLRQIKHAMSNLGSYLVENTETIISTKSGIFALRTFVKVIGEADAVLLAEVYAAGEAPIEGADKDGLVAGIRARGHRNVMPLDRPGSLAGIVAAYFLAARLSEDVVRLALGLVSVGFVGVTLWRDRMLNTPPSRADVAPGLFWGLIGGFASFVSHSGGPPFLIYVMPQRMAPIRFAGTSAVFFAAVNLMKVLPYLWLGQFSRAGLSVSLALLPLAIASTLAGVWVVRRVPPEKFYALVLVATFGLGVKLIYDGLRGLMG